MPGCENIHDGMLYKITCQVGAVPGTVIMTSGLANWPINVTTPDIIHQYNNATGFNPALTGEFQYWNMPRSMAIAYKKMIIDGIAVHLTEVAVDTQTPGNFFNTMLAGWSCETTIKIYGFCKAQFIEAGVQVGPFPNLTAPGFVITMNPVAGVPALPAPQTLINGLCYDTLFEDPQTIGTNVDGAGSLIYLAVSVTCGNPVSSRVDPISRHISVTVHGFSNVLSDMSLQ